MLKRIYRVTGANGTQFYTRHIEAADGDEAARKWRWQVALETGLPEDCFTVGLIVLCNAKS